MAQRGTLQPGKAVNPPINHINNAINGGLMTKMDLIGQEGMLVTEKIVIWIEEGVVRYIWDEIGQQWVNLEDQRR